MAKQGAGGAPSSGIIVKMVPGDITQGMSLERAPDSGGVAGTYVEIYYAPVGTFGSTGVEFTDPLPTDGAYRWYRARHVQDGYSPGSYVTAIKAKPVGFGAL